MLTMSEGLITAIEHDYEKNEALGLRQADSFIIITRKWLITREELISIVRNLHREEVEELGELV